LRAIIAHETIVLLITYWKYVDEIWTSRASLTSVTWAERSVSGVAENRVSGSGAWSGRPRSGSGAESGCHKNRLERWAANRPLTLRSHALVRGMHAFVRHTKILIHICVEITAYKNTAKYGNCG